MKIPHHAVVAVAPDGVAIIETFAVRINREVERMLSRKPDLPVEEKPSEGADK